MSEATRIRFDQAWERANTFLGRHPELHSEGVVLVRNLYGIIRIAIDDRTEAGTVPSAEERNFLAEQFHHQLGAWSPGASSVFLLASQTFAPDEFFASPDAMWADPLRREYRILDRNVIGSDWLRKPFEETRQARARRVTLFGIKGGAGRSTAAAVLAWRLSQAGKRVLVVDIDLESPGVGTTLLPAERAPEFGVVDWFVESAVGQADEDLLREMAAPSPLGSGGRELLVVPAGGRPRADYSYLPKLARAYVEVASGDARPAEFGERLHHLVCDLEHTFRPDVVLLDSRAGLHDIAAVTVTRMNATGLLFAVDTAQTWQAYRALFQAWQTHFDRAQGFRENLKMVASQIPETDTDAYLESFQQRSYRLFSDHLYMETQGRDLSEFNFDPDDLAAPHIPLPIHWSRVFQQFDPVHRPAAVTEEQLRVAFGDFVRGVALLAFGEAIE